MNTGACLPKQRQHASWQPTLSTFWCVSFGTTTYYHFLTPLQVEWYGLQCHHVSLSWHSDEPCGWAGSSRSALPLRWTVRWNGEIWFFAEPWGNQSCSVGRSQLVFVYIYVCGNNSSRLGMQLQFKFNACAMVQPALIRFCEDILEWDLGMKSRLQTLRLQTWAVTDWLVLMQIHSLYSLLVG